MNVLKTNNRFSSLLEDTRPVHNYNSCNTGASRYINKYKSDVKSVKIANPNINMNDFPTLIGTRANANVCDGTPNYVTKLLHQTNIVPETVEVLPYGWVVLTPNNNNHTAKPSITIKPSWENAMDSLVKLYNKRKDEYIAMWGEETYETVFLFPNYDYNYMYSDDEYDEDVEEYEDVEDYEYNEYYN
jgi:hypothetical protein